MSDNVNDPPPVLKPDVASQDVLVRKEEVRVTKKCQLQLHEWQSCDVYVEAMAQVTHPKVNSLPPSHQMSPLGSERHGTSQAEDSGGER